MVGSRRLYQESQRDGGAAVRDQLLHTPLSARVPYLLPHMPWKHWSTAWPSMHGKPFLRGLGRPFVPSVTIPESSPHFVTSRGGRIISKQYFGILP